MAFTVAEQIAGPILIGVMVNTLLYGIMIIQTYLYYTTFNKDHMWMKLFVGLLLLLDTLNTVFNVMYLYQRLVAGFGDIGALGTTDWVFGTEPAVTAIIAFCVQCFYAWRIYRLTSSKIIPAFVGFCAVVQLLGGIGTAIATGIVTHFVDFQKNEQIVDIWLVSSAVADCVVSVVLVRYLQKHRTGLPATESMINKLIRMIVSTGTLTAACAICDIIAFGASKSSLHLAFNMPLAKLYTNSLLSSLNARGVLFNARSGGGSSQAISSGPVFDESQGRGRPEVLVRDSRTNAADVKRLEVFVESESHEMKDVSRAQDGSV